MELKCSLFGHDYADYNVERERTDHGTEIVSTVRTTEACRRCGYARVLSENTEIAATAGSDPSDSPDSSNSPEDEAAERSGASASMTNASTTNESSGVAGSAARSSQGPEKNHRENGRTDRSGGNRSVGSPAPTAATMGSRSLEESELWCPACDFAEPALGSALRAGDSCPACTRGYLRRRDG